MHLKLKKCRGRFLMKITILSFFLTLSATLSAYSTVAQNLNEVKAYLPQGKITLRKAFKDLQEQTNFRFSFITNEINNQSAVNITADRNDLESILQDLLKETGFQYQQIGKSIIVKKNEQSPTEIKHPMDKQVSTINGVVLDELGKPIVGASIRIKDSGRFVISNEKGEFEIESPLLAGSKILVTCIGYQNYEYKYTLENGSKELRIQLQPDFGNLDEVTVIAYGTTSKRVSTSSTVGISSDVIQKSPINNPLEALQGRIAGLEVNSSKGLPGAGFTVRLRGLNSLRDEGNAPLYIVDGVPYFSEPLNVFTGDNGSQSPLAAINPSDIERIDVLKDADATAIYGSRGANGVILITTKKGQSGKTQVNFNIYTGAGKVTNQIDMLSTAEYLELRKEAFKNSGVAPDPDLPDLFEWDNTVDQNWQKLLMGNTAKMTESNLSISGGSEFTSMLISGTIRDETTVQPGNNGYKKGSGMLSINHRSKDNKLTVTATANYTGDLNNAIATDISQYYNLSPNMPIYDQAGKYYWYGSIQNPYAFLERKHETKTKALLSSASIRYNLTEGLDVSANLGYNNTAMNQLQMYPLTSFNPLNNNTNMSYFGNSSLSSYSVEPQVSYIYSAKKSTINLLAGATWQQSLRDGQYLLAEDFTSDAQLNNINAAVTIRPRTFSHSKYRYQAAFARATYNYDNKYIVNGTFRRDGSSRFGPDKRVGNFGSVGAAWVFTEERGINEALPFVNFGKLRGSYGITGNDQIGDYGYMDSWSYSSYPYDGISGLYPTRVANPAYSWERNKKFELGLELGFINNRLTLNLNRYSNISDNQLIRSTLSSQTGFTGYTANLPGKVENKGWEVELNSTNLKNNDFEWLSALNFSMSKNKLIKYPGLEGSGNENKYAVGHPMDIVFGFKFEGVDPSTGIAQFADLDGDGQVTNQLGDMYVLGTRLPKFFGGINNNIKYKNIDFSFLVQFVKQEGEGLNFGYMAPGALGIMTNFDRSVENRWKNPGDITDIPRSAASANDDAYKAYNTYYRHSDAQWVDASFVRLKNVMVSYDFSSILSSLKTQKISLYAQGQNLFTVTKYKGFDPETKGRGVPPLKYYTIGLRFTY